MLRYEIKKIFVRTGNRLALLLLVFALGITCYFAICGYGTAYVNGEGESEHGLWAARKLKEERLVWSGWLTEEAIAAVIEENGKIIATKEYQSENVKENNIAYGWGQGFDDIRSLINRSFCSFRSYDYYRINSLSPADAGAFYPNRTAHLREWLDTEAKEMYTAEEKAFFIRQYEAMETPLYYTYMTGWEKLFELAPTILMLNMLILGVVVAGIFSGEFSMKADAVFFSSCHGRGAAVRAKLLAGFVTVTGVYWIVWGLYTGIVLGILGADGADCMIQTGDTGWKSFYNISYGQLYWIVTLGGYVGTLFLMFVTMLVSAWAKSAVPAVVAPFVLLFVPGFLSGSSWPVVSKVLGLMPDQLLQMNMVVNYFNLYHVGGKIAGAAGILFVLYGVLTAVLMPVVYQIYKRSAA